MCIWVSCFKLFFQSLLFIALLLNVSAVFSASSHASAQHYYIDASLEDQATISSAVESSLLNNTKATDSYSLFTHGRPAQLYIDGQWLDAPALANFLSDQLRNISGISQATQINIYGCEFAKGERGKRAVSYLENALGVQINASNNITGAEGDWILEVGDIESYKLNSKIKEYAYSLQEVIINEASVVSSTYTVSEDGEYTLEIKGGSGAEGNRTRGGEGATVTATFELNTGDIVRYLVGEGGQGGTGNQSGGGGGSTGVYINSTLVMVAGGGGGGDNSVNAVGLGGTATTSGSSGTGSGPGAGGTAGSGGTSGTGGAASGGGSGGGILSDGGGPAGKGGKKATASFALANGGASAGTGGAGGRGLTGGAAAGGVYYGAGGGGYSGGGAGGANGSAGAGGSYVNTTYVDYVSSQIIAGANGTGSGGTLSDGNNGYMKLERSCEAGVVSNSQYVITAVGDGGFGTTTGVTGAPDITSAATDVNANRVSIRGSTGTGTALEFANIFSGGTTLEIRTRRSANTKYTKGFTVSVSDDGVTYSAPSAEIIPTVSAIGTYQTIDYVVPTNLTGNYKYVKLTAIGTNQQSLMLIDSVRAVSETCVIREIVAVDDTGSANGASGNASVVNVLDNDTLNGDPATLSTTTLSQTSTTNANVTLDPATGLIAVAAGTPAGTYTVVYQLCEVLNSTNCDSADAVITVTAAPIVALDDTGSANGASGNASVVNVLDNDTLNGDPATLSTTTLSQTSTTNANVTLDPATGLIAVAAGTPAGTYTVVYQLCEVLNSTNCDSADAVITVTAAPIVAVDDTGSANGASGNASVVNVLDNDTLNGDPATLSTTTLSQTSTTNANVTLDPATGLIAVAAGTPAGTYTVVYQLCEVLNSTNCDSADAVITVTAAPIVALDDTGSANGASGNASVVNVLDNDTLNGDPATLSTTTLSQTSTTNANVTLDPATGLIAVAAGTPAGTYTVVYQLCEVLNSTNCDSADAVITVTAAPIVAEDDTGSANGASGNASVVNVLDNDTLNGDPATLSTTTLSQTSTTNANVTLDPATGLIAVAAGTPAGTYTVVYQLCEVLNSTNCDSADAVITVTAAPIVAVDDTGSANGASGNASVVNVLDNDTLNGDPATLSTTTLSQTSTTNANVTLDPATGLIAVAAGTPAGTYTVVYQLCEVLNSTNCDSADAVITVTAAPIVAVDDTGSANGASGNASVVNVLDNDTLNGDPATLSTTTLSQTSTTNANVTLDPATGLIAVAAGTPAGTYTVVYQLCEVLNSTNCDSADAVITVTAAPIVAVDDTGSANGASGNASVVNVLDNDTLNGDPATLSTTTLSQTSTTNANVTLDPATGLIAVAAGTPAGMYTVVYQLCEVLNSTNCDSADAVITVTAAPIVAEDDTGSANGASGNASVVNVLDNDTLNGDPATLSTTTLSQTSTSNANVTLDPATGLIAVAAGTPAGMYTVVYQLCEVLNSTNCDSADAVITVTAAPIVVVDDTGSANGASGNASVVNVLDNDTLNGDPATLSTTTLSQTSTTNANVTLDPATGLIAVAAGTPAGTYTVVYQLCEVLNSTNCDSADAVITVTAAPIVVVDDTGSANGASGNASVVNVLDNDTLNGDPATLSTTTLSQTSTTNANVTLDPATGLIAVAAGTPAGTYTVVYQLCEVLNSTNCDSADAVITVTAAPIVAVDDTGSANGASGNASVVNVLDNDTLNGDPATLSTTTLSQTSTTNANVTLDPATGLIAVAAGTPAGTYTVVYQLCEVLNSTNCDSADAVITVTAAPIVAVDDTGSANGASGNASVVNVLDNDTLNGDPATLSTTTLSQTSTTNANVTLDPATGLIAVAAGTPAGTYTVVYQLCEVLNSTNCDSADAVITVTAAPIVVVDDTGSANGASGNASVVNVLDNDTLNGDPATLSTTTLSQTSTSNANVTLDPATGLIAVAAGTPAGMYTVVYQLCEVLNSTNCDSADAVITVTAAPIVAEDDTGSANGASGNASVVNVLDNDTLNGDPATLSTTTLSQTSTSNANVTLDPATGLIAVAAGTPAGTYTVVYQLCEVLNSTNCDSADAVITVTAAPIIAEDDTGSANGASGNASVVNVLDNDTLNGDPATLSTTTLSQTSTSNANVTLDPATGLIAVAAGTPAGTYTVVYQLCEVLNSTNCDSADAVITVTAAPIIAEDDTGSANGASGNASVVNVLDNDTLNGDPATLSNTTLSQTSTTNANVTLDPATGLIAVAAGTPAGTYTVVYQLCEVLNSTNCDSADAVITVTAAPIVALDDTGSANGASGNASVVNVLDNDTLNGDPATLSTTTLSQTSTTNANVTLDPATGLIAVAAGTPAGTYTVVYQLCEVLNSTNCDSADAVITVTAAPIVALDDTGSANGASGNASVVNVLDNDTLNGDPATLSTTTLSQTSTTNANVTLDPATGLIAVAAGTPAGTYTVVYQLCEVLNSTNCDSADAVITVTAAPIVAVDDTGSANGASGNASVVNVLDNDTLNGDPATLSTTTLSQTSTTNANVTLDPATGLIAVAAGTPAGTYTVVYQLCEVLNSTNCDSADAVITVTAAPIVAVDDTGSANGASGNASVVNVLDNDTLNGDPATLSTTTLSQTSTTNANVTLDPATGLIAVAAGTPAGTYTVVYQLCEVLNSTNCDSADAVITVTAAPIVAVDDTGSANGASGNASVVNVLDNDTLNGDPATLSTTTLSQTSTTNANVTLDPATGLIAVAAGTPAGMYTVVYQLCEVLNSTNCDSADAVITVTAAPIVAEDDTGSANGASGNASVVNVLDNDTLNGDPATLSTTTLSQTSTSNANVTLDPATGLIAVAAGTPAGMYTVVYQLCEVLNSTNCDSADAVITVTAAPIVVVDDTGSANGASGNASVVNVLDNDTLNGDPATLSTTTLSQTSTTNANVTLDPATGLIAVAAGTPAGTYTVVYQLCEVLNSTNCDSADAVITVTAAPIVVVDDTGSANGASGNASVVNVLDNDTLNGDPATLSTTTLSQTSTTNANVTLDPATGLIAVAAGTPAGTYTVVYQLCEVLNSTNCDSADAVITVTAAPIVAVDDTGSANGASGNASVVNVLDNDTLNGDPATLSTTTLSQTSTTNANVTLDPATGLIAVAAGTPAGTYTVVYQLCEVLNSTNCDSADAVITVTAAPIIAVDDTGSANGASGNASVVNVLDNDTLNGDPATLSTTTLSQTSTSNANVTLDPATGLIAVAAGTPAGMYTVVYQLCEVLNSTNCDSADAVITVTAAPIVAEDDTGSANGASGNASVVNVLDNDTLNGDPATLSTTTLSQTSTSNANVTLDPATGLIAVAAGTPAGTYTVVYQLCEVLNSTNCDSADAVITVTAAPIIAEDDTGSANGASGNASVVNVLDNDTLNGDPATLSNTTLSQTSTSNANVTLDPATGLIAVAAGTPAGTYTVVYQLCEVLNSTNCDSADAVITVTAAPIVAVDDTGSANGASGNASVVNVLDNDTLNGDPATLSTTTLSQTSTTNANVTLDPATGLIAVAAGTPAGTYTVVYQLCEVLNSTNCDSADAVITVTAAPIVAVDDTGSANGASGNASVVNVLDNDTLNGDPATLSTTTLSQTSTTNANVTLDPATGLIAVAAGTPAGTYTVVYQLCEVLNSTNCDSADAVITVTAAPIVALDDTGSANGASGNASVVNVLDNDTLNGDPATLSTTTLSQTSTTNANVTLDPATGLIAVAAGTPAGTYTVVYQLCEVLNSTNCDSADAVITVTAAPIVAEDDTGSANGASGNASVVNVLDNDTLNGDPATLSTTTLSQTSTTNANVTLDPATGLIAVAAGTPAGTYTVVYQLCEVLNSTNCDSADAVITVTAAPIVAVDDTGSANGASGNASVVNVLDNDTLNGDPATLSTTTLSQTSTTNANVTLDPATGLIAVAAGTPAGTYTVVYQLCEVLNSTNCDSADAVITVTAAPIVAVDDTGSANGASGNASVVNVLDNDTLNGDPATLSTTTLSQTSTTNANVTLDPATGLIAVAAGTPAGTYTVVYQLCEVLNSTNCDSADAVITVTAAPIVAVDDTGSANGASGNASVVNVLDNDTLNGDPATLSTTTLSQTSTTNANVTLDPATGLIAVAAGTPAGMYTVVYQLCEVLNSTNCDSADAVITVTAAPIVAEDDTGSANGASGNASVVNVLDNDTLNGDPATLSTTTLSQTSTSNANVTLDPATGLIAVAAGTPAGMYTVVYQLCEVLNSTNCDSADAVITVTAAPIVVVDDTGSANGASGNASVVNVLDNDTLNGDPATLSTTTLSQTSTTNANVTLDPATGLIAVAAGTPAGTYTVVYQLCEVLNSTNCDSADAVITVTAAPIVVVDDTGSANGASGNASVVNVLDNDTLNGDPATLSTTTLSQTSTTNANVTLDPATGLIAVAAGTPAGTYTVVYQLCEVLNSTNCDSADAVITVTAAPIVAVDDTGSANGASGNASVVNVLDNDTLNGDPATLSTTTLSQTSTTNANVTLDPATGLIAVAAGTPAGTYTVVYQLCEVLNSTNCDSADAVITVTAAPIVAVDDTGSANGASGNASVVNVLDNDTLNGDPATLSTTTLSQTSTTNANVTLDPATGLIAVAAGTPAGTYTVVYQLCEVLNSTNCDSADAVITVTAAPIVVVDDTGSANGASGNASVVNVLDNDTLNGDPATLSTTTLSQTSTSNANVTLDPATGLIAVAAGTPAGMYTVVYQLCEVLNSTNCDSADAVITVTAAPIVAEDDTGSANGASGNASVVNVLDNDTLNGDPATLSTTTLSQTSTSNANVTLDPATGLIAVAAGTPAGTYTVVYQLCEVLNSTNCDSADAVITVTAAPSWTMLKSTASMPTAAGQTLDYEFEIENTGNTSISNIVITDVKCATAISLLSGDTNGDTNLDADETHIYGCTSIAVTQAEVNAGMVDNSASVTGTPTGGVLAPANAQSSTVIAASASWTVVKSTDSMPSSAGETLDYQFTLSNTGNVTISNIVLSDVKCDTSISLLSGDTNSDGNLDPDEVHVYGCTSIEVVQAEVDAAKVDNDVSVSGTAPDGMGLTDAQDSLSTDVGQVLDWSVVKATSSTPDSAGDELDYTFTVENLGNVTISNIVVSDVKCASAINLLSGDNDADNDLDVGEIHVYGCTSVPITQSEVNAGQVDNTVNVMGNSPSDNSVVSVSDTISTDVTRNPVIAVAKRLIPGSPIDLDNGSYKVQYAFVISNLGNVDLVNVQLEDDLVAMINTPAVNNATFSSAEVTSDNGSLSPSASYNGSSNLEMLSGTDTLLVGENGELELSLVFTPDVYFGPFHNQAKATAKTPDMSDVSPKERLVVSDLSEDGGDVHAGVESKTVFTISTPSTPITLGLFKTQKQGIDVVFDWTTETEVANAGFSLLVENGQGKWVQINDQIIESQGDSTKVQSYQYRASDVPGDKFKIVDISVKGIRLENGPYMLGQQYGIKTKRQQTDWRAINAESQRKEQQRDAQRRSELENILK